MKRHTIIIKAPEWMTDAAVAVAVQRAIESYSVAHRGEREQPLRVVEHYYEDLLSSSS
jgi:hypothetical protein